MGQRDADSRGRRVTVWEPTRGGWKLLEGEIGGPELAVITARPVPHRGVGLATGAPRASAGECILIVDSARCVCRSLSVPAVSSQDIEKMVELRVETEVPYALADVVWAHQVQDLAPERGSVTVLLVAVPAADVAGSEGALRAAGHACGTLEARPAALAQAAALLAPDTGTVAVADVQGDSAALAVVDGGRLIYARSIDGARGQDNPEGAAGAAREIAQSLQHCCLVTGCDRPSAVLLTGRGRLSEPLARVLEEDSWEVRSRPGLPAEVRLGSGAVGADEVVEQYAACLGALASAHLRARGQRPAAPAVRTQAPAGRVRLRRPLVVLAAANVALLAMVVACAVGAKAVRLGALERGVASARSTMRQAEAEREEVAILEAERERRRSALDLLDAVVAALPEGVVIGEVAIGPRGSVLVTGRAGSVAAVSKAALSLGASESFEEARLDRAAQGDSGLSFRISCVTH
jgi:hypothetical protein